MKVTDDIKWADTLKSEVKSDIEITDAYFLGSLNLSWSAFAGSLILSDVVFCNDVEMSHSSINHGFDLRHAYFLRQPDFTWLKVVRGFGIDDSTFTRGADLTGLSVIGGSLRICHSEFNQETDFDEINVERNVRLGTDSSSNPCGTARFDGVVGFARARVGNNFDASQALFRGDMTEFDGMHVTKHAKFGPIGSLRANAFSLGAMTYGDIEFPHLPKAKNPEQQRANEKVILELVQESRYSSEAYSNLEAYYRRAFPLLANDAFIAGQRAYRKTYLSCAQPWNVGSCVPLLLNSFFLDRVVGYGRHTERVLGISLVLVVLAWLVFIFDGYVMRKRDKNGMEATSKPFPGFWYSVDLFVPGLDLGLRNAWHPRNKLIKIYAFIHRTMGWVLIPLAAAYLLGLVK